MTRAFASVTSSLVVVLVLAGCAATTSADTSTGSLADPSGNPSVEPWANPQVELWAPAPTSTTSPPTATPTSTTTPPTATPTPEAPAPGSTEITGTGYTYDVPEGWGPPPQKVPGFDLDSMALDLSGRDSFPDNVNVLLVSGGEFTPDEIETEGVKGLTVVGATHIKVNRRVSFAGSEAPHLSAKMSMGTNKYVVDQYYLNHEGQSYAVTFSFSRSVSTHDRGDLAGDVLTSWTWTD